VLLRVDSRAFDAPLLKCAARRDNHATPLRRRTCCRRRMADKTSASEATASSAQCAERVGGHNDSHIHGPGCGHQSIAHDGHTDYMVEGQRHHPHEGHCDNHGTPDRSA
jgi:hypothetical protein